jgi:hypothetical protein
VFLLEAGQAQLLSLIVGLIPITTNVSPNRPDLRLVTRGSLECERDGRAIVRDLTPSEQHLLDRLERALARFRTDDPATVALPIDRVDAMQIFGDGHINPHPDLWASCGDAVLAVGGWFVLGWFVLGWFVLGWFVLGWFVLGWFVLGWLVLGRLVSSLFLFIFILFVTD